MIFSYFQEFHKQPDRQNYFLNEYFYRNVALLTEEQAYAECLRLGKFIETKFKVADPMSAQHSKFFKSFTPDPEIMLHDEVQAYVKATKENNV